ARQLIFSTRRLTSRTIPKTATSPTRAAVRRLSFFSEGSFDSLMDGSRRGLEKGRGDSGALETDRDGGGEEAEGDEGEEEDDVAQSENALGELGEVRHHPDEVDQFEGGPGHEPSAFQVH